MACYRRLFVVLGIGMGLVFFSIGCGETQIVGQDTGDEEICDGLDNDGDTLTDEDDPRNGELCGDQDPSGCTVTQLVCDSGRGMVCLTLTPSEVCGGGDEDCDGQFDEGLLCGFPGFDSGFPPFGDAGF